MTDWYFSDLKIKYFSVFIYFTRFNDSALMLNPHVDEMVLTSPPLNLCMHQVKKNNHLAHLIVK